jgi:thiol-disulfide isomerase/thioredoxin
MVSLQTAVLALAVLGGGEAETVLLDFYSDACPPCRRMDPTVRQLIAMGYPVRKLNVNQHPALASQYGVNLVPCFVMLSDGKVVDRVVGETSLAHLEQMCTRALSSQRAAPPPSPSSVPIEPQPASVPILPGPGQPAHPEVAGQAIPAPPEPPPGHQPPLSDWRGGESAEAPAPGAPISSIDDLIAATVRLRIEDADGHSCGSGTIIDARDGEALVLTCGHIFRDSEGKGLIEVDVFGPAGTTRVRGCLLSYDLDRDVGLVSIGTPGPVATARVAPTGYRAAKGQRVINVGCNNGDPPTARYSRVTSLDKFVGPPNLQVAGLPVQGRSGGGLFSQEGLLIGVCNAADPSDNEGLYAALASIHDQLDRARLSYVYRSGGTTVDGRGSLAAVNPPSMPKQMPQPAVLPSPAEDATVASRQLAEGNLKDRPTRLTGEEAAALEEIRRRKSAGAEVICVIRSRSDPYARSEILVLNDASSAFLERLAAEARPRDRAPRQLTSLEIPHPRPTRTNATSI